MDSLEAIQRDYLTGAQIQLDAFNRLMGLKVPVVPVAMSVQVMRVEDSARV